VEGPDEIWYQTGLVRRAVHAIARRHILYSGVHVVAEIDSGRGDQLRERPMAATQSKTQTEALGPAHFFTEPLEARDPEINDAIGRELDRQQNQIELIASENIVSRAVLQAQGSVLTNKYAEGYPGRRYYGGCDFVDRVEELAIRRVCALFECSFANVQPNSGSQANQAVLLALLKPGDTVLGMSLAAGGHLTHGAAPNLSGKWFNAIHYGVRREDARIDFEEVARLAAEHKPQLIIAGGSAYSRIIDFKRFREIADGVGAYFMVDMAHFAGLVAGGIYPSPLPHAHVVTSTTHKTLRGPRGGLVLCNDETIGKKINSAVFPGLQGGPLMHVIAGKAVAFHEALQPAFKVYARQVVENAKVLAVSLVEQGFEIVSGGTDSHVMLVDLRPKKLTGKVAEHHLEQAAITCNKNGIPFDPEKPVITSGIRLGTPAATTRGFREVEFRLVGEMIGEVLDGVIRYGEENSTSVEQAICRRVRDLCARFPIYAE
jgi:glycine hydroxymethyltransferase